MFIGPLLGSLIHPVGGRLADRLGGARVTFWNSIAMAVALAVILWASAIDSLGVFTAGFVLLFMLTGIGNGSTYKMIPALFRGEAKVAIAEGEDAATAFARARRLSGAAIGIVGAVGALGGLFINLAFRQAFLTAKTGDPAYWSFLAFYVVCAVVTFAYYLRPAPAHRPRIAYAGV